MRHHHTARVLALALFAIAAVTPLPASATAFLLTDDSFAFSYQPGTPDTVTASGTFSYERGDGSPAVFDYQLTATVGWMFVDETPEVTTTRFFFDGGDLEIEIDGAPILSLPLQSSGFEVEQRHDGGESTARAYMGFWPFLATPEVRDALGLRPGRPVLTGVNPGLGFTWTPGDGPTFPVDDAQSNRFSFFIPEPISIALLGAGLLGVAARRRRR